MRYIELRRHTMRIKPGDHLSQAGVTLARQLGETMGTFQRVMTSPIARAFETAIAMGFAVDEEDEAFSVLLGDEVEMEVGAWDAGFAAFGSAYKRGGATRRTADMLAAHLWRLAKSLPDEGAALVISHGGIIEAAVVGCFPKSDHAEWGQFCDYCEGARLTFGNDQFISIDILRVKKGELP